jgi:hypothetical protein
MACGALDDGGLPLGVLAVPCSDAYCTTLTSFRRKG